MADAPGFRLAGAADAERIGEIARAAYSVYEREIGVRPRPIDHDYDEVVARRTTWVPGSTGDTALYAFIVLDPRPGYLWIDNVAVDPGRQGTGVGGRMLDFAERRAAALGLAELRLLTSVRMLANIAFYERRGFERDFERDEEGLRRQYMRKPLAPRTS